MEVRITKIQGLRNDLLAVLPRTEVEDVLFHIANRDKLMQLPGLLRHVPQQDSDEKRLLGKCKIPVEEHLKQLSFKGRALMDDHGKPTRPALVIGSRNVGNNHGFIAWQKAGNPRLFQIQGEPFNRSSYSCLTKYEDGRLAIRDLRFEKNRVLDGNTDITEDLTWCVFGNQVLRDGKLVSLEETIDQYYDIRHILAFERARPEGRRIEEEIYEGYPNSFRANAIRFWREEGVPRNRFLHNSLGISDESIFILQREGTIEEIAYWLKEAGAENGIILDNGASPFCWAWYPNPNGGFLFTAPDFRPNASAVVAFILKGSVGTHLPSGSAGFTIV